MLGSNQRPLPCEVRSILSWLFAVVQKYLQNGAFAFGGIRVCSLLFMWVGVLLVRQACPRLPREKQLYLLRGQHLALRREPRFPHHRLGNAYATIVDEALETRSIKPTRDYLGGSRITTGICRSVRCW